MPRFEDIDLAPEIEEPVESKQRGIKNHVEATQKPQKQLHTRGSIKPLTALKNVANRLKKEFNDYSDTHGAQVIEPVTKTEDYTNELARQQILEQRAILSAQRQARKQQKLRIQEMQQQMEGQRIQAQQQAAFQQQQEMIMLQQQVREEPTPQKEYHPTQDQLEFPSYYLDRQNKILSGKFKENNPFDQKSPLGAYRDVFSSSKNGQKNEEFYNGSALMQTVGTGVTHDQNSGFYNGSAYEGTISNGQAYKSVLSKPSIDFYRANGKYGVKKLEVTTDQAQYAQTLPTRSRYSSGIVGEQNTSFLSDSFVRRVKF